jgi:hypothetical protein
MEIDLSAAPHRVNDLLRYLRQMGYDAYEAGYAIVEVDEAMLPETHFGVAAVALALRLGVWNAVNDAEARLIESSAPLGREKEGRPLRAAAPRVRPSAPS